MIVSLGRSHGGGNNRQNHNKLANEQLAPRSWRARAGNILQCESISQTNKSKRPVKKVGRGARNTARFCFFVLDPLLVPAHRRMS